MKVVRIKDLEGTEREVVSPAGWTRVRFLLKEDGMGFSFHETTFPAGLQFAGGTSITSRRSTVTRDEACSRTGIPGKASTSSRVRSTRWTNMIAIP